MLKKENKYQDYVFVIGGGPAGMMAALQASKRNRILLIEQNKSLGKKFLLTGGGRCNITFKGDEDTFFSHIAPNPKFMMPAFRAFNNQDLLAFFKGINFKEEGDKIYPVSDSGKTLLDYLERKLYEAGVEIFFDASVREVVIKDEQVEGVILGDTFFQGKSVIMATGGKSYPGTGSDGTLLKSLPVQKVPFKGVLLGLYTEEDLHKLAGISLPVTLKYGKREYQGDILFTHQGLSGPLIFDISRIYNEKESSLEIDFFKEYSKKSLETILFKGKENPVKVLSKEVPRALVSFLLGNLEGRFSFTKEAREQLLNRLKTFKVTIKKWSSIESAIVCRGGIDLKEIDPKTMGIKSIKGLYACGETINLDGATGGYNLQIAFSTGYLAGSSQ